MSRIRIRNQSAPFGDTSTPAPTFRLWAIGGAAAVIAHAAGAIPFLPPPLPPMAADMDEGPALGVRLAPMITPPEPIPPEPVPEVEEQVIEERASDSPPPAPPAKPRELPDLPDISPRAVPDLWRGSGTGDGGLTLEEYLALKDWLDAVRTEILQSLTYPPEARRAGLSGRAQVIVLANREGRIVQWSFRTQTGHPILDREIKRSIDRIRRLPKFPPDTQYDELSFSVPIRFELVYGRGDAPPPAAGSSAPQAAPAPPPDNSLPASQLRYCAATSADLTGKREAIALKRQELESLLAEYEANVERYERQRREPPLRVRNQRRDYEQGVQEYDALVVSFQTEANAFSSVCGGGSANWENYVIACGAYANRGNAYCEAYGELWLRLQAEARR